MGNIYNSNILFTGSNNGFINSYKVTPGDKPNIQLNYQIPCDGIINDIKISSDFSFLAAIKADEHRLGRWITSKEKNRIIL